MELRDYLTVVWRRKWYVVLAMLVAAGSAVTFSMRTTPLYEATSKVFAGPRSVGEDDVAGALQELSFSRELTASYAEVLRSRGLAEQVIEETGANISPAELASQVETRTVPDTRIIEITVTHTSPRQAQRFANEIAAEFVEDEDGTYGGRSEVFASVFERALLPASPVSPKPLRDGLLGAALGLALGIGMAFLMNQLDSTLRTSSDVEDAFAAVPVLATIPAARSARRGRKLFFRKDPDSPAAEAFRILKAAIPVRIDEPALRILVTSPGAGEGKSTVAANLAVAFAAAGARTALIETDLRRPVLHEYFGLSEGPGLSEGLLEKTALREIRRATPVPNLVVISGGKTPPNPSELLGSSRMDSLMKSAAKKADVVILDSPPALAVADATIVASQADVILLVVRSGQTHSGNVKRALKVFERMQMPVLGIVLNDAAASEGYRYYRYARLNGARERRRSKDEWQIPSLPGTKVPARQTKAPAKHTKDTLTILAVSSTQRNGKQSEPKA